MRLCSRLGPALFLGDEDEEDVGDGSSWVIPALSRGRILIRRADRRVYVSINGTSSIDMGRTKLIHRKSILLIFLYSI